MHTNPLRAIPGSPRDPAGARAILTAVALVVAALFPPSARAQNQAQQTPYHAVVTAESLSVRSGRSSDFYEVGRLKQGEIVVVREVSPIGWATIAAPPGFHAFVAARDVNLNESGQIATTVGRVKLLYPDGDDPLRSWRGFLVDPDTRLAVVETVPTSQQNFLKVRMPESADVFVPAQFLRKATSDEVAAWRERQQAQRQAQQPNQQQPRPKPNRPQASDQAEEAQPDSPTQTRPADQSSAQTSPEEEPTSQRQSQDAGPAQSEPSQPDLQEPTADQETPPAVEDARPSPSPDQAPADDEGAEVEPTGVMKSPTEAPVGTPATEVPVLVSDDQAATAATLAELEAAYDRLTESPIEQAEIEPLLNGYRAVVDDVSASDGDRQLARLRVQLLEIRLQAQRARLDVLEALAQARRDLAQLDQNTASIPAGLYNVQGRLVPSNLYNGRRLPLLYRVQDPDTGRTIAYVAPTEELPLGHLLGRMVGVLGPVQYDATLNARRIEARRVDELPPGAAAVNARSQ